MTSLLVWSRSYLLAILAFMSAAVGQGSSCGILHVSGSAALGRTVGLTLDHTFGGSGAFGAIWLTPPFAGIFPWQIPGFTYCGDPQVDLTQVWDEQFFAFPASQTFRRSITIPIQPIFIGIAFEVQGATLAFGATAINWSNEVGMTIAAFAPPDGFVAIPAGTFQMGSIAGIAYEQPVHAVTITRPFWASAHEVSQMGFSSVMSSHPSFFQQTPFGESLPVEQVTWSQAMAYCAALTSAEAQILPAGYQYRLPTEAEWEYLCRAGSTSEWSSGASLTGSNFHSSSTWGVMSGLPNGFGMINMHGNVWEWCLDSSDVANIPANYPSTAVSDPYVSTGPDRVVRGGSWFNTDAFYCRSAMRSAATLNSAANTIGFRVVLAPILVP